MPGVGRTTVVITLEDVRDERLDRLKTAIKTHLVTFGRNTTVKGLELSVVPGLPRKSPGIAARKLKELRRR